MGQEKAVALREAGWRSATIKETRERQRGAVAAGLALQAIQVLPVLGLAAALVGWSGLRRLGAAAPEEEALEAAA